ncbi:hypothetical protein BATDEDRAFT_11420 [Batrachochytrium dendrobatidis JAM81]|uniref:rRNA methyltransferase 2, mitochondrial n=1 Tax=Batrachochytrium dendrobatidis (strain JAM81 / FGSC 10211) TaxID=684364 RepID=F4P2U2_BATDJ|nr:uncharacterized protein BATDEDRAFT_11420 [Batrachochytrium dendrobatidis JAM81]EGF80336.1 hypothetical protein BATDEDRAFT_11420 [Batrachochytrium dendrobatidis JAM81]|eukprot:XP_006678852.1 hypothetical protein BATDEDRAFT_11420 [Batrachochytrium dendrobatidis JAM81]
MYSSGQWFNRQASDPFVKNRIKWNLRSRSAFKLKELQSKYNFMKPGQVVLDLGAAPGGWTQVALDAVWPDRAQSMDGRVIAVDLLPIEPIDGAEILLGDVHEDAVLQQIYTLAAYPYQPEGPVVDVVLSDMAHSFTGHRSTDAARVQNLCEFALSVASHPWLLKPGGNFLCKYLRGDGDQELKKLCQSRFQQVIVTKPKASRQGSAEAYFLCLGFIADNKA